MPSVRKLFCDILPRLTLLAFCALPFLWPVTQSYAQNITLQWDASADPDLVAGYRFYYSTESRFPDNSDPYNPQCEQYAGAEYSIDGGATWAVLVCPPPIVVGSGVTQIMFKDLADDKAHFFAVIAYDFDDLESDYSNEEATLCITWPVGGFYVNEDNQFAYIVHAGPMQQR